MKSKVCKGKARGDFCQLKNYDFHRYTPDINMYMCTKGVHQNAESSVGMKIPENWNYENFQHYNECVVYSHNNEGK